MVKTPEEHAASCAERAIVDYNNEVLKNGRDINQLFIGCFMDGFLMGRRVGIPEKIKFEQDLCELNCLRAERELINNSIIEIESHYLTRCVRFLQSFHKRIWWKVKRIFNAGRYFIEAFLPTKKGYECDPRTPLYRTLQAHLKDLEREGVSEAPKL